MQSKRRPSSTFLRHLHAKGLRLLLFGAAILLVGMLVFLSFSDLSDVLRAVRGAHAGWLALAIVAQAGTYTADALAYSETLRALRVRVHWWEMVRVAVVMEFLADIAPSFGMSSNIYLVYLVRKKGFPRGASAVFLVMQAATSFVAFAALLLFASVYLLESGQIASISAMSALAFVSLGALFWVGVLIILAKDRWADGFTHAVFQVGRLLLRSRFPREALASFLREAQESRSYAKENWARFLTVTACKLGRFVFDAITLFLVFHALHQPITFGIVAAGYAAAAFFATISFLPGGLGSFEVTMALVYTAFGVSLETAGLVTLLFRGLSFWLPLPLGLLLFQGATAGTRTKTGQ